MGEVHLYGKCVIRGNSGFSGRNTYICENKIQITEAVNALFKKNVKALFSKFYDAKVEIRAMMFKGKMQFGVEKYRGKDGFHNLSKNAKSGIVTDKVLFIEVEQLAKKIMEGFNLTLAGIDIMVTTEGLKVLEISIPNVGKFYQQHANNPQYQELVINYFQKALLYAFEK